MGSHLSPVITGYKACSSSQLSSPSKVSSEVFKKLLNKTLEIPSEKRKKFTVPIEQLWFEYLITNLVIQVEAFVFKRLGSHSFWHYSLSPPHSLRSYEVSHLTMKTTAQHIKLLIFYLVVLLLFQLWNVTLYFLTWTE